jgi:hypothetical protein
VPGYRIFRLFCEQRKSDPQSHLAARQLAHDFVQDRIIVFKAYA